MVVCVHYTPEFISLLVQIAQGTGVLCVSTRPDNLCRCLAYYITTVHYYCSSPIKLIVLLLFANLLFKKYIPEHNSIRNAQNYTHKFSSVHLLRRTRHDVRWAGSNAEPWYIYAIMVKWLVRHVHGTRTASRDEAPFLHPYSFTCITLLHWRITAEYYKIQHKGNLQNRHNNCHIKKGSRWSTLCKRASTKRLFALATKQLYCAAACNI